MTKNNKDILDVKQLRKKMEQMLNDKYKRIEKINEILKEDPLLKEESKKR